MTVIAILPMEYGKSANQSLPEQQGSNIPYSCLVICSLSSIIQDQIVEATSLGIAAMMLDDDFKHNISKHAQLLFAVNLLYGRIR
jgi:superfamily II DNA helicase RecQ